MTCLNNVLPGVFVAMFPDGTSQIALCFGGSFAVSEWASVIKRLEINMCLLLDFTIYCGFEHKGEQPSSDLSGYCWDDCTDCWVLTPVREQQIHWLYICRPTCIFNNFNNKDKCSASAYYQCYSLSASCIQYTLVLLN